MTWYWALLIAWAAFSTLMWMGAYNQKIVLEKKVKDLEQRLLSWIDRTHSS